MLPPSIWPPRPDFLRLFRGDGYRFEFGVRRGDTSWFQLVANDTPDLAARRQQLREHADWYVPWDTAAEPVLDEFLGVFGDSETEGWRGHGRAAVLHLGGHWEPDWVLLRRSADREFRLVGGCVASPSAWDPSEKLGLTVAEIHRPVPTLNPELGPRIRTFLDRLPTGEVFLRENWGLAAVGERDLHPRHQHPRLGADVALESVWLRVEHQAFRALPGSDGLVFVIALTVHPLREVLDEPGVAAALHQQLVTMPAEIARYKGLEAARDRLLELTQSLGSSAVIKKDGRGCP